MEAEPRIPTAIEGLETFSLGDDSDDEDDDKNDNLVDADSFFNLPNSSDEDEDEQP